MKLLTYTIPCYNSSAYMDHCISSLLATAVPGEVEIVIVDDGSTKDDTAGKADDWQRRHPGLIRVVHQENGGHGEAINAGLRNATGRYFKVVDSDDWVCEDASRQVLEVLRRHHSDDDCLDLLISNYVYEHQADGAVKVIRYTNALPENRVFGWDDMRRFLPSQNLLMHSLIYRTEVLRGCGFELPKHTFYVDNIYAYTPLPHCKRIYYLNCDFYRYFIGRDDQSVNERVMVQRIDQQLKVTRIMIDKVDLSKVRSRRLRQYMTGCLAMMMAICTVFSLLSDRPDRLQLRDGIWEHLRERDERLYRRIRHSLVGSASSLPGSMGRRVSIMLYRMAQRIFKFN